MIYLILSILSSTAIFTIFKILDRLNLPSFPVIVYNYLFAIVPGFFLMRQPASFGGLISINWLPLAIVIGILFIVMFYVVGRSSQKAGISITTVASKMSVATPIMFSIFYDPNDRLNMLKFAGIILALVSVFLIVYRKKGLQLNRAVIYLPILLFIGMGIVDSLVKYAQYKYISDQEVAYFTVILFMISFVTGMVVLLTRKKGLHRLAGWRVLFWGFLLGMVNFGSIFFLIRTLNFKSATGSNIDSSVVFAVNNTGIVVLSVLTGLFLFRETLNRVNRIGIMLSLAAIFIFSIA